MSESIALQTQALLALHLEKIKQGIVANMAAQHRTVTGRSVASLVIEPTLSNGMALYGGPQWASMQSGRKPGKVPYNFREIIKDWIKAKGISIDGGEKGLNTAAFLISRHIMKHGTRLYQHNGNEDIYDSLIEKEFANMSIAAVNLIGLAVDKINDKFVKS